MYESDNAAGRLSRGIFRKPLHRYLCVCERTTLRGVTMVALTIWLVGLCASNASAGDWNCDKDLQNKPQVTTTWFGLGLDQPFKIRLNGERFIVPVGYLVPWPTPRDLEHDLNEWRDRSFIWFAFWMPSQRHPEHNRLNVPRYHPCEAGREPPGPNEFIVFVALNWPINALSAPGYVSPELRKSNWLPILEQRGGYETAKLYGLYKYIPLDEEYRKKHFDSFYSTQDPNQIEVDFRCSPLGGPIVNPLCDGEVFSQPTTLGFTSGSLTPIFHTGRTPSWRRGT